VTSARQTLDLAISETDFQRLVTELAGMLFWSWYHTHDSRRSPAGFPDLVLVRERVIFVELKTEAGRITQEQAWWLTRLSDAGAEVYLWRPSDFDKVERTLRGRAA
jgi:hypothetical protein